jgi:ABC-type glycerol-3-phosphate transport system substrate-binding protein
MLKKFGAGFILFALILAVTSPVFAGGGGEKALKGADIILGNYWETYDVNTYKPKNEVEERELEWRKKFQKDLGFKMQTKQLGGWGEMLDRMVTSVMAGKPAAEAAYLAPDWAMAMYKQGLLYPVSDSKAVNWKAATGVAGKQTPYNQEIQSIFTFNGKFYAFNPQGVGGSQHGAGVYFNKRLFREAGLNENLPYDMQKDGSWTWDNFIDLCKKLTRDTNNDGRMDTYAMTADLSTEVLDLIVFSNMADYVIKNAQGQFINTTSRPEFIEALQFARRLLAEGVMMPRPEDSSWDWYWPMFHDGKVAMMMEPEWRRGQMRDMTDNWGFVLFPKGPRARNYRMPNDENVIVVPSSFKPDQVDGILLAVDLWHRPVTDDWKSSYYPLFRDRRAVDETIAMIRNPMYSSFRYHMMVPNFNRGDIAWEMWWFDGEPAQLVESVSASWNALFADASVKK